MDDKKKVSYTFVGVPLETTELKFSALGPPVSYKFRITSSGEYTVPEDELPPDEPTIVEG